MRIAIIIAALFMASCATQKRCMDRFPVKESRTDSIVYKERIVKVPSPARPKVIIKKDSVYITDTVNCPDENKEGTSVNGNLILKYKIQNNRLKVTANNQSDTIDALRLANDSLSFKVTDLEKYSNTIKVVTVENESLKKDVKYLKKLNILLILFSILLVIGHLARSYNRLKAKFPFLP